MVRAWSQKDAAVFIRIQANATAPMFLRNEDERQKWRRAMAAGTATSQNYEDESGRRRRQRRRGGFTPEDFS